MIVKLYPKRIPYSSIVGGGVMFVDGGGVARFQLVLMGTTRGISKAQSDALAAAIVEALKDGVETPHQ